MRKKISDLDLLVSSSKLSVAEVKKRIKLDMYNGYTSIFSPPMNHELPYASKPDQSNPKPVQPD
jgi:hypothetical protein